MKLSRMAGTPVSDDGALSVIQKASGTETFPGASSARPSPVTPGKRSQARLRRRPVFKGPDVISGTDAFEGPDSVGEGAPSLGAALARRSLAVADMLAVGVTLFVVYSLGTENALLAPSLLAFPAVVIAGKLAGLYDRDEFLLRRSTLDEVPRLFYLATVGTLAFAILQDGLVRTGVGSTEMVSSWVLLFVCLTAFRSLARVMTAMATDSELCLVVGDAESTALLRYKLETTVGVNAAVVAHVQLEDGHGLNNGQAGVVLREVDEAMAGRDVKRVILAPGRVTLDDTLGLITQLKRRGLKVSLLPPMSQVFGTSVEIDRIDDLTLLGVRRFAMSRSSRAVKRTFDLVGSSAAILALSPVFLVTALAIKATSRGPVLFRQVRIGRNGNTFEIYKFRSMVTDAEERKHDLRHLNEATDGLFKIENDPRITSVGAVIRRWHIDELPQFLNVLLGHMSLVGPRPLVPEEDRLIQGWHRHRLNVAPGVTGHWQVMGSARVPLREMVTIDYAYVANWSLWNDITLLARTIPHVLRQRGM